MISEDCRDQLIRLIDQAIGVLQDDIEEDVKKQQAKKWATINITNSNGNVVVGDNVQVNSNNQAVQPQLIERLKEATQTLDAETAERANQVIAQLPETSDPGVAVALMANLCTIATVFAPIVEPLLR